MGLCLSVTLNTSGELSSPAPPARCPPFVRTCQFFLAVEPLSYALIFFPARTQKSCGVNKISYWREPDTKIVLTLTYIIIFFCSSQPENI